VVRAFFRIDDDDKRSLRRYRNEVRVRNGVALSSDRLNLVGSEGNRAIELANGGYDHAELYPASAGLSILLRPVRRTLFVVGGDAFFGFRRFARFQVMFQGALDVLADGSGPEFFQQAFGI